jgi:hypothetical protein
MHVALNAITMKKKNDQNTMNTWHRKKNQLTHAVEIFLIEESIVIDICVETSEQLKRN